MNFAKAVKTTVETSEQRREVSDAEEVQRQARREEVAGKVEVVCRNTTGKVFTKVVNLEEAPSRNDLGSRTSENSAIIRKEVKQIYEEMMKIKPNMKRSWHVRRKQT